jgi:hypothetical protein
MRTLGRSSNLLQPDIKASTLPRSLSHCEKTGNFGEFGSGDRIIISVTMTIPRFFDVLLGYFTVMVNIKRFIPDLPFRDKKIVGHI